MMTMMMNKGLCREEGLHLFLFVDMLRTTLMLTVNKFTTD